MLELLLGNTVVAACLALFVLLLCRIMRPGPATRHALWFLVVLKLLSPVGLLWQEKLPFARPKFLDESVQVKHEPATTKPAPLPEPMLVYLSVDGDGDEANAAALRDMTPDAPTEKPNGTERSVLSAPNSPAQPTLRQSLYMWCLIIWLAGAAVVAWRYLRRTIGFAHYARSGKAASASLQRQVDELASLLRVRAPVVRVLPDLPSPVVWSLRRPVLLWPKGLQDQLSAEGRRAVIVHELAHLVRKDHWFRWMELIAAVVHWWNPLFWFARRQMRFHAELACDAWVTGMLPEDRRAYAEALLEVCARTTRAAAPSPAVGVGGEGRRDFQRRLTMIMRDRVPCRLAAGAKMFVVLMAIAALPAWTLGQAQREPLPAPKVESEGNKDADQLEDALLNLQLAEADQLKDLSIRLPFAFAEAGAADEQKIKELEARLRDLLNQLKAIEDAKAAADKLKRIDALKFTIPNVEGKPHYFMIGPDNKVIEGGNPKAPPRVEFKPLKVEVPLELRLGPDGKVIEVTSEAAPKPAPPTHGIRAEVIIVDGKPVVKIHTADGKEMRIDPATGKILQVFVPQSFPYPLIAPQGNVKVIGADGKEIKDVKILIDWLQLPVTPPLPAVKPAPPAPPVRVPAHMELKLEDAKKKLEDVRGRTLVVPAAPAPQAAAKMVTLTRATYKLPKDKAEALAAFLKANIKASVLELKVDENGLTVTTTPEAQTTIGGLVNLMLAKGGDPDVFRFYIRLFSEPSK